MTYKEIKAGMPVYALHKGGDELRVSQGKVVVVSGPRFQNNTGFSNFGSAYGQQTQQQVVDITIDLNGETKTYSIPDNLEVTYAGQDLVLATCKDGIVRELEAMKGQSEDALRLVDRHRRIAQQCTELLADYNPIYKEKRETEERFQSLEGKMANMTAMLEKISSRIM